MVDNHVDRIKASFDGNWKNKPKHQGITITVEELEAILLYNERLEILVQSALDHTWQQVQAKEFGIEELVDLSVTRPWLWEQAMNDKEENKNKEEDEGEEDGSAL